jgi:hypothetical protein
MSVILAGVLHGRIRTYVLGALQNSEPPPVSEYAVVLIVSSMAFAVVSALGVGVWTIVFTHRISGPLFILGRWLEELGAGRLPTLRPLRKKDEFKDFYGTFKHAVDKIRVQKEADLERMTEAVDIARKAVGSDDAIRDRALETVAVRLESLCEEVADALGETYELSPDMSRDSEESVSAEQFEETHA